MLASPAISTTARPAAHLLDRAAVAELSLHAERTVTACPLRTGVCFPRGRVRPDSAIALHDEEGRPLTTQSRVLATWPDGSVKWLLFDALADEVLAGRSTWTLHRRAGGVSPRFRSDADSLPNDGVDSDGAHDERSDVESTDGTEQGAHGPRSPGSLIEVRPAGDRLVLFDVPDRERPPLAASLRLDIRTDRRERRMVWSETKVLAAGPVLHQWRFTGRVRRARGLRVRLTITSYAALGLVRIDVRLHNPNRARHQGGFWDLGDPGSIAIDACELVLGVDEPNFDRVAWRSLPRETPLRSNAVSFLQDSSGGENWTSRTHFDRTGFVPSRFRGCRIESDDATHRVDRACPTVVLEGAGVSLAAAVPEFWQRFPSALEATPEAINFGLLPEEHDGRHELQGGERTTRTIWLSRGDVASLDWVHTPVTVSPSPRTVAAADVLPWCDADPTRLRRLERFLEPALDGPSDFYRKREAIDEYGWRNFGDLWADHEAAYFDGPAPVVSHYNNQFDGVFGFLAHHLRTADPRWRRLLDPLARHVVDVDLYHTDRDRACYNGGLFWHTDHYVDAATATHRTYSVANRDRSPGGGPSCEHGYTTGMLHHYYLTGDEDARAAVVGLAEWVLAMDDGSRTPFALVDDGPTGYATSTASPEYHGPGRGAGNSVNTLVDAWTLTGERRYLDAAETFIRRVVHPGDDIDARDLLNVERRWSYTVFLASLAKYLERKLAAGENDRMYAYGVAAQLRYAEWMAEHERPYFDHPEQLEYPTETWAAQEFRKANALRLAARWADEPLRSRLLDRGREFSERAWVDLERFESRHVTRAVVILMTEGLRDAHLASHPHVRHSDPVECPDFGEPEVFVPQRERFKAVIKSPTGLLRIGLRLLDVRRWPRLADNLRRHL